MKELPPSFVLRFLKWFCPDHLYEEIEGDLIQRFNRDLSLGNSSSARRRFIWNTIRFFRPGIVLRNRLATGSADVAMLSNYFKVALRVLNRSRSFSAINITGLAFGITGATLLYLWIAHEFSYDQFHVNKDRIYVAWNRAQEGGAWQCWSTTPRVLAPTLRDDYAGVEAAVSYANYSDTYLFSAGDTKIQKDKVVFVDPEFLTMFSFPMVRGDEKTALSNSSSIVLTEHFARMLFGDADPFGETVTVSVSGMEFPFTVTGILKDLPSNTDFDFEFLIPWQFLESAGEKEENWYNNSVTTLVMLRDGTDIASLNAQIRDIKKTHTAGADDTEVFLYAFSRNHLYTDFVNGVPAGGRIEVVRVLIALSICLVAIACINFINLSTARAQSRAKEVAVRKMTGAGRRSLVIQFLCESVIIAWAAGILSLAAAYFALPYFNVLVQQHLSLRIMDISQWAYVLAGITSVGFLAGSYPALYLSSFRPVRILKGGAAMNPGGGNPIRNALVVFQFGVAVVMIVATIVVRKQIEFVQARNPGYTKENLVYQYITGDLGKNYVAYRQELVRSGLARSVTKTSSPITHRLSSSTSIRWKGKDPGDKTSIERFYVDDAIISTAGLEIIAGRDFDLDRFPADSTGVILNETAVSLMSLDQPVGEIISDNGQDWHVIGVVKDFILTSPYQKVEPMVLVGSKHSWAFNVIHIRLNEERSLDDNIGLLSGIFSKYNPDYPFEYHFIDLEYGRKFDDMGRTLAISNVFTSIAIFIACLGLFGLSTHMAASRVKEIGVRKVLGGSILSITKLLSASALKPIFLAIMLFSPLAWAGTNNWLASFGYRIAVPPRAFLMAAVIITLIAMFTIGWQTIRAASANPVKSLRNE